MKTSTKLVNPSVADFAQPPHLASGNLNGHIVVYGSLAIAGTIALVWLAVRWMTSTRAVTSKAIEKLKDPQVERLEQEFAASHLATAAYRVQGQLTFEAPSVVQFIEFHRDESFLALDIFDHDHAEELASILSDESSNNELKKQLIAQGVQLIPEGEDKEILYAYHSSVAPGKFYVSADTERVCEFARTLNENESAWIVTGVNAAREDTSESELALIKRVCSLQSEGKTQAT